MGSRRRRSCHDDEKLAQRVDFIHQKNKTAAIAEQYIKGREIYVGVIGNQNIQTYAPWELVMEKLPEGAENIATLKVKWDPTYQERVGVKTRAADLTPEQVKTLERLSKRIYRYLFLSGYARLDYRMTEEGQFYLLEANPNPQIAHQRRLRRLCRVQRRALRSVAAEDPHSWVELRGPIGLTLQSRNLILIATLVRPYN